MRAHTHTVLLHTGCVGAGLRGVGIRCVRVSRGVRGRRGGSTTSYHALMIYWAKKVSAESHLRAEESVRRSQLHRHVSWHQAGILDPPPPLFFYVYPSAFGPFFWLIRQVSLWSWGSAFRAEQSWNSFLQPLRTFWAQRDVFNVFKQKCCWEGADFSR